MLVCKIVFLGFLKLKYNGLFFLLIIGFEKVYFLLNTIVWQALRREHSFKDREITGLADYNK